MKIKLLLSVLVIAPILTFCSKENEAPKLPANVKSISNLGVNGKWVTFSFEKGVSIVAIPTTISLDWDITSSGHLVKLNGGTSREGRAAALNIRTIDFASINKIPEGRFAVDTEQQVLLGYPNTKTATILLSKPMIGGFGPEEGTIRIVPENKEVRKRSSVYRPTKWVYVLKRASDGCAKFQLTDCYSEGTKAVYPTSQYRLSDDGNF